MDCDQGIELDEEKNEQELVEFFKELFTEESLVNLTGLEFILAKNLFVEINKKSKLLSVATVIK